MAARADDAYSGLRGNIEKDFDKMMRQLGWNSALCLGALSAATSTWSLNATVHAAPPERPTFNHTADPRPNILPDSLYNHHEPYRLRYNRPTYHVGKAMYYVLSPTSQEAMVWKENLDECRYEGHHCPPVYKSYMYPKPWEQLNTGPRPTFASANAKAATVAPVPPAPSNPAPKDAEKVDAKADKQEKTKKEEQAQAETDKKADSDAASKEKALEKVPAPK